MKHKLTNKKFSKKWPRDEWLQKNKRGQWVCVTTGNLKKWISFKYYGDTHI